MTRRDYNRPAGRSGGKGIVLGAAPSIHCYCTPRTQRDTELLRDAFLKARTQCRAAWCKEPTPSNEKWKNIYLHRYRFIKSVWFIQCRNPRPLSDNVLKACMRILQLDALPALPEEIKPLGLQNLPKKPPKAYVPDDES